MFRSTPTRDERSRHTSRASPAPPERALLAAADNASGNFVKVAQRIPVLIRLDALPEVPLRPGMSANITVYTGSS